MGVFVTWIVFSNKYLWFPILDKRFLSAKIRFKINKVPNKMCYTKWRKCSSRFYTAILNIMFLINSAMHLKIMKDSPQMYMSKWILINSPIFFSIVLKVRLKALHMKILLKISLVEFSLIKLFVKDAHIFLRLSNHF